MIPIVPAIIPKSEAEVVDFTSKLSFLKELHLDVVDGKFVPFVSWPYQPVGQPVDIKQFTDPFTLEVDLMVEDPLKAASAWLEAGADMLVFHVESISLAEFTKFKQTAPVSVGISALNDTALSTLLPYLAVADYIQLMGIAEIGAQGQKFDERVIMRLQELKSKFPKLPITIDGSVNKTTIKRLKEAGADRFICGSAVVGASDPKQAYLELVSLIN